MLKEILQKLTYRVAESNKCTPFCTHQVSIKREYNDSDCKFQIHQRVVKTNKSPKFDVIKIAQSSKKKE